MLAGQEAPVDVPQDQSPLQGHVDLFELDQGGGHFEGRAENARGATQLRKNTGYTFTLNCSPRLSDSAKADMSRGISSRSFKLTTSTGECM